MDMGPADVADFTAAASVLKAYHQKLLDLMAVELAETPGEAQQAVYDAQVAKVEEMQMFCESAGLGSRSSFIGR